MKRAILLIEDDIPIRCQVKRILERRYTVYTAETIEGCRCVLRDHHIDLILLDMIFPDDGGGRDPALHLRRNIACGGIPIVAVNDYSDPSSGEPRMESAWPAYAARSRDRSERPSTGALLAGITY